jgi:hypothetical protein
MPTRKTQKIYPTSHLNSTEQKMFLIFDGVTKNDFTLDVDFLSTPNGKIEEVKKVISKYLPALKTVIGSKTF